MKGQKHNGWTDADERLLKHLKRIFPDDKDTALYYHLLCNEEGLTEEIVNKRKEEGFVNVSKNPTNKSYLQIIIWNIITPFNVLMFAVAGILFALVGPQVLTNLLFIVIIVANLLIGTIQEMKSKHTIEKLKLLSDSKSKVRRNGQDTEVT